ncbi:hypothetical protein K435DRAFT_851319 [Dendrothele bispora CBS 962.96]|uniref:Uncharacterized protein n=1 Tax=Dendrothele bispora (strain CBS 962.96) TaxID=1314807 RepID=A0A4S8MME4_DENBC|nr:hypothetical protein K435DRAFT_851319 [Dendrothele bispora CBS 962.96]
MYSQRLPPPMIPSNQVRLLWTDFELWHAAQRLVIEQRVAEEFRKLDHKWRDSLIKNRISQQDFEEFKTKARLEIEKTFSGNMVRLEWQKRLDRAGLQSDAWDDMTEAEQRKVERILGAGMDPSELAMPTLQNVWTPRTGTLFSPVANHSRIVLENISDSYAVVDPHSFSAEGGEDNEFDPWEVVKSGRSDDEISLDASTSSSLGFDSADGPNWSSAVSRTSTQTSQTSSPEQIPSKFLASDVNQQSLLSAARLLSIPAGPAISTNHQEAVHLPKDLRHDDSSSSLSASSSFEPVPAMNEAQRGSPSKSRNRYIGPELLTDHGEPVDEEAEFEQFKIDTRIQKIREFHEEAAEADTQLTRDIAEARKSKSFTRGQEIRRVEEHERNMLDLRRRKEDERRMIVDGERQRRKAEQNRRIQTAPIQTTEARPDHRALATKLGDQGEMGAASVTSETPTIRQQRSQRNGLQMDWSLGGDTPTLAGRSWTNKDSETQTQRAPTDVFTEAPPLKRLSSAPGSSQSQPPVFSGTHPAQMTAVPVIHQNVVASSNNTAVPPPNTIATNENSKAEASKTRTMPEPKAFASSSKTTLEKLPKASTSAGVTFLPTSSALPQNKSESAASSISVPMSTPASTSSAPFGLASTKPKAEPISVSSSKSSSSSNPAPRPKVEPKSSSSSVPSVASTASISAKTRVVEPLPPASSLATSFATNSSKPRATDAVPTNTLSSTISKPRTAEPIANISNASSSAWPASNPPKVAPTSTTAPPSAWTSWVPPASLSQPSQIPEDRRRWVPPAPAPVTTEKSKRPLPSRKMTEPAPRVIEKSVSNSSSQTKTRPVPIEVKRARRLSEPPSPSPRSFEFPSNVTAGSSRAVEVKRESEQSGILKKQVENAKPAKGAKPKKVTIEEIEDDDVVEEVDHLPTDSRYIMEPVQPKPVVPPAMFSQIFEYDGEKEQVKKNAREGQRTGKLEKVAQKVGPEVGLRQGNATVPNTVSETKINDNDKGSWTLPDASSSKPIKPKQVRWSSETVQRCSETQNDSFLSILDSLEAAIVDSGDRPKKEEVLQQTNQLNRLLSETRRTDREGKGPGSLGPSFVQRGGGVSSIS